MSTTEPQSLPSPPFIEVSGVNNFRDAGGYASALAAQQSIRRGVIYRSAQLADITPGGIEKCKELGITHVFDVRSNNEIARYKAASKEWDGCRRVSVPVFKDENYSPEDVAIRYQDYASEGTEGFTRAYMDVLKHAPDAYRPIFLHLAHEQSPMLIHCTAGKDRTGVFVALVLSLCGVDDETIAYEYSLTELGLAKMKPVILEHLMANPAFGGDEKGALNMISARKENMKATLRAMREEYGSAEKYMIEKCGLTEEEVKSIRSRLLVEESNL